MKTVYLTREFDYSPHRKITVRFKSNTYYLRVIDAAARAIEAAGAGRVVVPSSMPPGDPAVDASHAWKRRIY